VVQIYTIIYSVVPPFLSMYVYFHSTAHLLTQTSHTLSARSIKICRVVDRHSLSTANKQQQPFTVPPEPKQQAYAAFMPWRNHNLETATVTFLLELFMFHAFLWQHYQRRNQSAAVVYIH